MNIKELGKNSKLLSLVSSLKEKKNRDKEQLYILEGTVVSYECLKYKKNEIVSIFISKSFLKKNEEYLKQFKDIEIYLIDDTLFKKIIDTNTPQGIFTLLNQKQNIDFNFKDDVIILDNIQDPGNLGTIIRSAESFNIKNIFLLNNCVDLYNPKVLRATMASILKVSVYLQYENDILEMLKQNDYEIYACVVDSKNFIQNENFKNKKCAFILGNEANGISKEVLKNSTKQITIPMNDSINSLNVSQAGSIIMYENFIQKEKRRTCN